MQFYVHFLTSRLQHHNSLLPLNSPVFTEYDKLRKPISNGFDMRFLLLFPSTWSEPVVSVSSTEFSEGVSERLLLGINFRLLGLLASRRIKDTRFVVEVSGSTITSLSSSIRRKSSGGLLSTVVVASSPSSNFSPLWLLSWSMCILLLSVDSPSSTADAASACKVSVIPIILFRSPRTFHSLWNILYCSYR